MRLASVLLVTLIGMTPCLALAQRDMTTFHGCGMRGDAQRPRDQDLDELKNRWRAPASDEIDTSITLPRMLEPASDIGRFSQGAGAVVEGLVKDAKVGGIETANCHARDAANRDTHIELVDPNNPDQLPIIVEVTPRWRDIIRATNGDDRQTATLKRTVVGKRIRVTGWMLYDIEHLNASENTAPGNPKNWRSSAWEIHPITGLEILE